MRKIDVAIEFKICFSTINPVEKHKIHDLYLLLYVYECNILCFLLSNMLFSAKNTVDLGLERYTMVHHKFVTQSVGLYVEKILEYLIFFVSSMTLWRVGMDRKKLKFWLSYYIRNCRRGDHVVMQRVIV